ncbi:MAG: Glutaredoxin [Blastocatellia bacterium]|nr:Glutaredoxin [Blastocatellia bacterium]
MTVIAETEPVRLYVVPDCPLCAHARAWLEEHNVSYIELDVGGNFGALRSMYGLTRQRLVPVFEAGGRALVRPSDPELAEIFLKSRANAALDSALS